MDLSPAHLLLVEEDALLAEVTQFRLELLGYRVDCVHSGRELLRQLAPERPLPDLLVIDLALPDIEGLELLNRLSSDARTSKLPVLVFSTDADLTIVQRAFAAGAKDFLVTPFDPTVLERKVESLVAGRSGEKALVTV